MKRPRFRISVRLLMVTVLALGLWLGLVDRTARIQREAAEAVRKSMARTGQTGVILYDRDWIIKNGMLTFKTSGKSRWSNWLMKHIGVEYFDRIIYISIEDPSAEELSAIGRLGNLDGLTLVGEEIDDGKLAMIAGLPVSEFLEIRQTSITDAGLATLDKMDGLRIIQLDRNPQVTEAGVGSLRTRLPKVEIVD